MPSQDVNNCSSYTTVKIYDKNGKSSYDTYTETSAWDLPLNTGAKAKIRSATKAVGTHKAKSYDTNYTWVKTSNTKWER